VEVYGFQLPASFVQLYQAIRERKLDSIWVQKGRVDAYGRPWKPRGLTIVPNLEVIREVTAMLPRFYHAEHRFQQDAREHGNKPGFIADFTDVSKLVWFGRTGSGEPYCFDFGDNPEEPSVIFWDEYWRRVAPNFASFIVLFQPALASKDLNHSGPGR
jgi:hypothetical protein